MKVIVGVNFKGEPSKINQLVEDDLVLEDVVVEGELVEVADPFQMKKGGYIHKGIIFDGTMSIAYKIFAEEIIKLTEGMSVKVHASTDKHEVWTKGDLELTIKNMMEVELDKSPPRIDKADKKRVELQTHTLMSEKAPISAGEYIKRAKELGHNTIAITDVSSVQAYPEAYAAALKEEMKVIYGLTGRLVDENADVVSDADDRNIYNTDYVVFDVETTGFSVIHDHLIEIGASKFTPHFICKTCNKFKVCMDGYIEGEVHCPNCDTDNDLIKEHVLTENFNYIIKSPKRIPPHIIELTGITNEMMEEEGVSLSKTMVEFQKFMGDAVLVAHNAIFDRDHINMAFERVGIPVPEYSLLDTLNLSRLINNDMKIHNLKRLSGKYKVKLDSHHRAYEDAEATGYILLGMLKQLEEIGVNTFKELNAEMPEDFFKFLFPSDFSVLARNKEGLKNLYKLVSYSHTDYLAKSPVMTKQLVNQNRKGLLIGSGGHTGKLFQNALEKPRHMVLEEAKFYDYIEIQPSEIASHLAKGKSPNTDSIDNITEAWKTVYSVARELNKPIVATGHVNYFNPEDRLGHNILYYNEVPMKQRAHEKRKGKIDSLQGDCYFRTTQEMIEAFDWLSDEEAYEIVVTNSNRLADLTEDISPLPDQLYQPKIEGIDDEFRNMATDKAKSIYGSPIPQNVEQRLNKELDSIIGNGYSVIYMISQKLVKKSIEDGYLVGSRGSVGSSFAATMTGITEVNPLKPHYVCPSCKWSIFINHEELGSGYDLPTSFSDLLDENTFSSSAINYFISIFEDVYGDNTRTKMSNHDPSTCPKCHTEGLKMDGQDIPFETFLGFNGDKVPDIDLNFSGVYQPEAHRYTGELFGMDKVLRAGTIGTVADKTAFGYVKNYVEFNELKWTNAEVQRWAGKIAGAKKNSGQHPGGMLVIPDYIDVLDITPYQYPANDVSAEFRTSHFDFHAIHDNILKLDILGHEAPTVLRLLHDFTGIDPRTVPSADEKVLKLFYDIEGSLGVTAKQIMSKTGTLGIPEMGTKFVQDMLVETKPKSFQELVKISGLSHGTDVWIGNAQENVARGNCEFKEVIGCRDDIMVNLQQKGLEDSLAFTIMEFVRKGKGLKDDWEETMLSHGVPEWYIESCKKIKYMFPKAHASAYVLDATRIGWYKVYKPVEYYAALFSSRYSQEDILEIIKPADEVRTRLDELKQEISNLKSSGEGNSANKKAKLRAALNLALEAKERGIKFGNVRMYESHEKNYIIDMDTNELIPPFSSIVGIGETAAIKLANERKNGAFRGVADLQQRTGVTKTNLQVLKGFGCLDQIEERQYRFF